MAFGALAKAALPTTRQWERPWQESVMARSVRPTQIAPVQSTATYVKPKPTVMPWRQQSPQRVFNGSFSISNALLYAALSKMFANLHEKCAKTRKSTALHRTFLSRLWRRDISVTTWSRRVPPKRVRVTGLRRRQRFTLTSVKGIDVGSRQNLNEAAKIVFPNTCQIIREYLLTRQAELQITK